MSSPPLGLFKFHERSSRTFHAYMDGLGGGSTPVALPPDWSTTEVETDWLWIDNRPVFRKAIAFGALPDTATKTVAHGIGDVFSAINMWMDGYALSGGDSFQATIPSGAFQNTLALDDTDIIVITGFDMTFYDDSYCFIEYVKGQPA